ncbi:CatB-related O-acetyltransferase [Paucidesulfovibrio longus]|uniref:CatB-related O-acetyltransferase n=1 Tax=Paucidesulfovibrio longus TaxID=889 RepID=UPI0003B70AC9|nr:CatB-related O-acetyltransferase [Paucidesulfovibrio longus]
MLEFVKLHRDNERRLITEALLPRAFQIWRKRRFLAKKYPQAFVSIGSNIAPNAHIGNGCLIYDAHVDDNVSIGDYCAVGQASILGHGRISIGKFCSIAHNTYITSTNRRLRSRTTCLLSRIVSSRVTSKAEDTESLPVTIGNDVWLGWGAVVLPGAVIPDGCVVGANAVVTKRAYKPYSILGGAPASILGQRFSDLEIARLLEMRWWDDADTDMSEEMVAFLTTTPDE